MVKENVRNCTKKSVNKLIPDESGWMQHVHQRHMPQSATHPRVLGWNHRLNQLEPSLFQDFTASRSKVSNDLLHCYTIVIHIEYCHYSGHEKSAVSYATFFLHIYILYCLRCDISDHV